MGICESETHHAATVLPSEGNEVRQDGFQEVGTLRSTYETGEHAPVDPVEERESQFAELLEGKIMGTSSLIDVSTKLQQVAELSGKTPKMVLTTLAHHIDVEFLHEAYRRTRKV